MNWLSFDTFQKLMWTSLTGQIAVATSEIWLIRFLRT